MTGGRAVGWPVSRAAQDGWLFWGGAVIRLAGIFVAGLALILLFREVMIPILKGDVDRVQQEHREAELSPGP